MTPRPCVYHVTTMMWLRSPSGNLWPARAQRFNLIERDNNDICVISPQRMTLDSWSRITMKRWTSFISQLYQKSYSRYRSASAMSRLSLSRTCNPRSQPGTQTWRSTVVGRTQWVVIGLNGTVACGISGAWSSLQNDTEYILRQWLPWHDPRRLDHSLAYGHMIPCGSVTVTFTTEFEPFNQ